MIKWVTVYRKYGAVWYRVLHESNRLYEYYNTPPKSVAKFIQNSKQVIPYNDKIFKEEGYTYWA